MQATYILPKLNKWHTEHDMLCYAVISLIFIRYHFAFGFCKMSAYSFCEIVKLCADPIKLMNFLLIKGLVKCRRNCARVNCRRRMILTKDSSKKTITTFVARNAVYSVNSKRVVFQTFKPVHRRNTLSCCLFVGEIASKKCISNDGGVKIWYHNGTNSYAKSAGRPS